MANEFYQRRMGDFFVTASQLNHMNILHGGVLVTKADSAMGLFANSFCHTRTLTGRIDKLIFYKKSHRGDHISFVVTLLKTTRSTMTIYAEIDHISLDYSHVDKIGEGVFTYVAVDSDLRPIPLAKQYQVQDSTEKDFINKIKKNFNISG